MHFITKLHKYHPLAEKPPPIANDGLNINAIVHSSQEIAVQ
jgi:hypothetical protein